MYLSITGLKPHGVNESKNLMHHRVLCNAVVSATRERVRDGWNQST